MTGLKKSENGTEILTHPTPKLAAMMTSRMSPSILHAKATTPTALTDLTMLADLAMLTEESGPPDVCDRLLSSWQARRDKKLSRETCSPGR